MKLEENGADEILWGYFWENSDSENLY